jgi:cyclopropane-fatty-acyl-phospholipid synthase
MGLFTLEQSKAAYRADFALYGAAVLGLTAYVLTSGSRDDRLEGVALAIAGLAAWTGIEYAIHRFVLHGIQPFRRWHAEHHERPAALICAPTLLSGSLITALVFFPALALLGLHNASAITLGVLAGYLGYGITHHATHHWRAESAWLKRRKLWHALHHRQSPEPGHYGVSSALWDYVFGSRMPSAVPAGPGPERSLAERAGYLPVEDGAQ